jgi:hypothetical protein
MIKQALSLLVMADGLISAIGGTGLMRWLRDRLPDPLDPILNFFARMPQPLFRIGAAAQAIIGAILFLRTRTASPES